MYKCYIKKAHLLKDLLKAQNLLCHRQQNKSFY